MKTVAEDQRPLARTVAEGRGANFMPTVPEGGRPSALTVSEHESARSAFSGEADREEANCRHTAAAAPAVDSGRGAATVFVGEQGEESPRLAGWLVCTEGSLSGRDFRVSSGKNTLGRHPGATVLLSDTSVSGSHAVLWLDAGRATLVDNNSSNGILVNGERVYGPTVLALHDRVRLGLLTLLWVPFDPPAGTW